MCSCVCYGPYRARVVCVCVCVTVIRTSLGVPLVSDQSRVVLKLAMARSWTFPSIGFLLFARLFVYFSFSCFFLPVNETSRRIPTTQMNIKFFFFFFFFDKNEQTLCFNIVTLFKPHNHFNLNTHVKPP